ncbi:MAG TPA: response regulator [Thermomicrobiales bacterium]|nr:response regulator [Thermomicrobiales bacterium]
MGTARVLLVDDDQLFIRRMQRALDGELDLQVATTSCDALTRTADWMPDIVVLDPLLGDADSFGLLDRLRASWQGAGVGVICLSRGAGSLTRYQRADEGFYGTVMRDSGTEGVCHAVRFALAGNASASQRAG